MTYFIKNVDISETIKDRDIVRVAEIATIVYYLGRQEKHDECELILFNSNVLSRLSASPSITPSF